MPSRFYRLLRLLAIACALSACATPPKTPAIGSRWEPGLADFARADREHPPSAGGVLFVGSSSIRFWDSLETSFKSQPVILKRGFVGFDMSDCTAYLDRLVLPYRPRLVLIYAGDNDLAEGRSPQQVLDSFAAFVDGVHRRLPKTRILYISIKPSPARVALMPQIRETNARIEAYIATAANTGYIDVFTPMLSADRAPRPELFRADELHLNEHGYALWTAVISAHLGTAIPVASDQSRQMQ